MDSESLQLLEDGLRKTMTTASGQQLDAALAELGWLEMLDEMPEAAVPLVFRLLGETGAHAPVLNDVVLRAAGREGGGTVPLPLHRRLLGGLGPDRRAELGARRRFADTPCARG